MAKDFLNKTFTLDSFQVNFEHNFGYCFVFLVDKLCLQKDREVTSLVNLLSLSVAFSDRPFTLFKVFLRVIWGFEEQL